MVPTQDAVLVVAPDEGTQSSVTSALRDHWPVRTATTAPAGRESLDESVAVVVLVDALEDPTALLGTTPERLGAVQVLWIGDPDASIEEAVDATVDPERIADRSRHVVDRLQRRARYDRLLTRFYELARARESDEGATPSDAEMNSLKRELDELVADLDDEDAFEIALGTRRPANR